MHTRQNEIDTLMTLMKQTKDKRMFERYQAIQLYLQGYSKKGSGAKIVFRSTISYSLSHL